MFKKDDKNKTIDGVTVVDVPLKLNAHSTIAKSLYDVIENEGGGIKNFTKEFVKSDDFRQSISESYTMAAIKKAQDIATQNYSKSLLETRSLKQQIEGATTALAEKETELNAQIEQERTKHADKMGDLETRQQETKVQREAERERYNDLISEAQRLVNIPTISEIANDLAKGDQKKPESAPQETAKHAQNTNDLT